jgi:hypothetical protein
VQLAEQRFRLVAASSVAAAKAARSVTSSLRRRTRCDSPSVSIAAWAATM